MAKLPPLHDAAQERAQRALNLIEQAQTLLSAASSQLCAITNGGYAAYRKVGREYDRVHDLWYAVRALAERGRGKWDLDEMANERHPKPSKGG